MKRTLIMALVSTAALVGCTTAAADTASEAPPVSVEAPPVAVSPAAATCIDSDTFAAKRDTAIAYMDGVAEAFSEYDAPAAAEGMRNGAEAELDMADYVEPVNPIMAKHLTRSANLLRMAASAVDDMRLKQSLDLIEGATNELMAGVDADLDAYYC